MLQEYPELQVERKGGLVEPTWGFPFVQKKEPDIQVFHRKLSVCCISRHTDMAAGGSVWWMQPALEMTMGRTPNDDRSDSMNPNNDAYDDANDNRSNQLNPNNERYQGDEDDTEG